jgi:hypothetical protein
MNSSNYFNKFTSLLSMLIYKLVSLLLIIHLVTISSLAQTIFYDNHALAISNGSCTYVVDVIDDIDTSQILILNDTVTHCNGSMQLER